jgi:hypothetical protein
MDNNKYRIYVLISSILSSIITINSNKDFKFLFIIPILYGILYYYTIKTNKIGPGLFMMNIVLYIRYIVFPPLFKISNFKCTILNKSDDIFINTALALTIIEILFIFISYNTFSKIIIDKKTTNTLYFNNKNNFIQYIIIIFGFLIIANNPTVLNTYNSILNTNSNQLTRELVGSGFELQILSWSIAFLTLGIISYSYVKYLKYKTNKYFYISSIVCILNILFYKGTSRLSLLIPLITFMFLLLELYPNNKNQIKTTFFTIAAISLTIISSLKFFGNIESNTLSSNIDLQYSVDLINAYFGGFANVIIGVKSSFLFDHLISYKTIINDIFGNAMGISKYFDITNKSSYYFNYPIYTDLKVTVVDQIIPTIIMGYMYFGIYLCFIPTVIMVYVISRFDYLFRKEYKVEYLYLYAYMSSFVGFTLPGNLTHLTTLIFNFFIPLYILFKISRLSFK